MATETDNNPTKETPMNTPTSTTPEQPAETLGRRNYPVFRKAGNGDSVRAPRYQYAYEITDSNPALRNARRGAREASPCHENL